MAEVYATPDHISPEPQEVSVDTLAQEELAGMQSRLSALADAGTVADHVVTSWVPVKLSAAREGERFERVIAFNANFHFNHTICDNG